MSETGLWIFAGGDSLLNSDDVIYAQMARESLESGHLLEHTWMGVVLFEKPPLLLWLLQLSGAVFGFSDSAMRIPAALGAMVTLIYVFKVTRFIVGENDRRELWAWLSACVLLATWTFTEAGSRVMTDTLLSAAIVAMCYYGVRMDSGGGRTWSVRLGLAAGLGFMAKSFAIGPTALVVAAFLVWRKRRRDLLLAVGVAACIAVPWHAYMTLQYGNEFWDVYFGYHVLGRAGVIAVGQEGIDFFFIRWLSSDPMVVFLLIPCALAALLYGVRHNLEKVLLPLSVALVGLIVLHASQTKFIHYAVPFIPLLVITAVWFLSRAMAHRVAVQILVIATYVAITRI